MTPSSWVRALRDRLQDHADDVLALWRQRSGSEVAQNRALCEAMIRCQDDWELSRRVRPWQGLRAVRRQLEAELYG